jgi:cytochrome c-type biogenesis protein CcmH
MNPIYQTAIAVVVLAAVALTPLAFALRRGIALRGRRDSALALHRAQLEELDRELEEGRIGAGEHATAKLEVQRRLLAEAEAADPLVAMAPAAGNAVVRGDRALILTAMVMLPLGAVGLYLIGGHPELPDAPRADMLARAAAQEKRDDALIDALREKVKQLEPQSEQARTGYVLLGNVEDNRGHLVAAADAWQHALDIRFDPTLAAQVAEAQTQSEGRVSARSAALYRRALDAAPKDAPWRGLVEKRLAEANQSAGATPN